MANTLTRLVAQWAEILGNCNATNCGSAQAAANRILGDLVGYRHTSQHRAADIEQLANALEAYALLVQRAGLKLPDPV